VSWCTGLSRSDRSFPALTGRSGTQRARGRWSPMTFGASVPWSSSSPTDLRITSVSRVLVAGSKPTLASGSQAAADGSPGTSGGHAWSAPVVRRPPGARRRRATARLIDTGGK
jgi:hypothetical protein